MEGALSSIRSRAEGQGLAEYALILSLIALVAVVAVGIIGGDLNTMLSDVGAKF
jgi:Flp pilus assembly pilin Flp